VAQIVEEFRVHKLDTMVLTASFKTAEQVHKCAMAGSHGVTVTDNVLKTLVSHPMTDAAIAGFDQDWKGIYGNKTIMDF